MPTISESRASLRIFGDDLDPDEISERLGRQPTRSLRLGETKKSGKPARTGSWLREAQPRFPADLDVQIAEIFECLSQDSSIWADLTQRHKIDLFCGLFLTEANEGVSLSPDTLLILGTRNILIDFDIYSGDRSR